MTSALNGFKCRICDGDTTCLYSGIYDDRYGFPGIFEVRKCLVCRHCSLGGPFETDFIRKLYTDYYPRTLYDVDAHQPHREISSFRSWITGARANAFRWVPRNVRVLDIGCGFGRTLGYHQARGCEVFGVEADENIKRVADRYGYNVHAGLFDSSLYEPESFDYVTLDQVIEHVNDPVDTLREIAYILNPGGTLILSTPNADGWNAHLFGRFWVNWHAPYHQHFFSQASLTLAAEKAGLTVVEVKSITQSIWMYYQWVHLLTHPNRETLSPLWSPSANKSIISTIIKKAFRVFHYSLFNHLASRIADASGGGDNLVFVLKKSV